MPITLTVTAGPHQGQTFTFQDHDTFLVGRSPDAHFSLPDDPYFSRLHFLIELNPPLCRLADLKSRNGTLVNAKQVTTIDLQDGDEIQAGQTRLTVSTATADRQAPPTRSLPAGPPSTDRNPPRSGHPTVPS